MKTKPANTTNVRRVLIDPKKMFLAMRDIFYGGEFSHWLEDKEMPMGAMKEYKGAYEYFCSVTGFESPTVMDLSEDMTLLSTVKKAYPNIHKMLKRKTNGHS